MLLSNVSLELHASAHILNSHGKFSWFGTDCKNRESFPSAKIFWVTVVTERESVIIEFYADVQHTSQGVQTPKGLACTLVCLANLWISQRLCLHQCPGMLWYAPGALHKSQNARAVFSAPVSLMKCLAQTLWYFNVKSGAGTSEALLLTLQYSLRIMQ